MSPTTTLTSQNPWPGLRAFTENDRDFFFGRERETAELLGLVQQSPAVVLFGQSGLGKTSLVQAGLFPELKRLDFLPFRLRFDHGEDAPPLAQQIKNELIAELDRSGIKGPRPAPADTLWEFFHRRDLDFWGPGNRLLTPVIALDQFEELFTLGQRSEKAAARIAHFAADLESVLEHRPPEAVRKRLNDDPDDALHYDFRRPSVKFLVSLREDYLAYLDPWRERIPTLLSSRFRLEPMTGAQALEVVRRGGHDLVDEAVARDIVDFVCDSQRRVAPALLSVVLDELNHRRVGRGKSRITPEFLSGEREKIIQDFYDRSFEGIDPRVRAWVEDRLLTAGGHRQPAALEDALAEGLPGGVFELLENRRILHRAERDRIVWLELTHDLLTDPASRSRAEREQRRQTEEAVRRQEQYRRELKKSRVLAGVFGVLLLGVAVALVSAIHNRHRASREEKGREAAEKAREDIYRSAANIAERLSVGIGLKGWVPVATVEQAIEDTEKSYKDLNAKAQAAKSSELEREVAMGHARFLAGAAEALYQAGHFEEGLTRSTRASSLLPKPDQPGSSDEQMNLVRAEILYEEGKGSLALGNLDAATRDFTRALSLVKPASPARDSDSEQKATRVFILSQIGLGDVDSDHFNLDGAQDHLRQALDRAKATMGDANRTRADRGEAISWEIQALLKLGFNQRDPSQSQILYSKAGEEIEKAFQTGAAGDASNPHWKALAGELAYDQGSAALSLGQDDRAKSLFEQAIASFAELENRDPENSLWQLMLASSRGGLGRTYRSLKEWDLAQSLSKQAEETAAKLNKSQPTWVAAGLLRGATLISGPAIVLSRLLETLNLGKAARQEMLSSKALYHAQELRLSLQSLDDAAKILKNIQTSAPEDPRCSFAVAEITLDHGMVQTLYSLFVGLKGQSKQARLLQSRALADIKRALVMLDAIEPQPPLHPSPEVLRERGLAYSQLAGAQEELKKSKDARDSRRRAIEAYRRLVASAPTAVNYESLSNQLKSLGDTYYKDKDYAQALSQYKQALSAIAKAVAKATSDSQQPGARALQYSEEESKVYGSLAKVSFARGDRRSALDELKRALDNPLKALPGDYTNMAYLDDLETYKTTLKEWSGEAPQNAASPPPHRGLHPEESKSFLTEADALLKVTGPRLPSSPAGAWSLPPVLPGEWRILAPDGREYQAAAHQMLAAHANLKDRLHGIRSLTLGFYDDAHLYDAEVDAAPGLRGDLFYVQRGREWVPLDGSAGPIDKLNRKSPPHLDTAERAMAYLRFYMGAIQSEVPALGAGKNKDEGTYLLVDRSADLPWLDSAAAQQRAAIGAKIKPLWVTNTPDHEWQTLATVEHGGNLYETSFRVSRSGSVNVSQASEVAADLPIFLQYFSANGIRVQGKLEDLWLDALTRDPEDKTALNGLLQMYAKAKEYDKAENLVLDVLKRDPRNEIALQDLPIIDYLEKHWHDAVQAEKNWIAYVQHEVKSDADRKGYLIVGYLRLSWYQLFARDFAGALASAEAGKELDPSDLNLTANLAHALLFLGRTQESDAIYLGNRGKRTAGRSGERWEDTVLEGFAKLEGAGLTSPEFAKVRSSFRSSPQR